jgi:hypothetical protein
MSIGVVVFLVVHLSLWGASTLPFISKLRRRGYKEGNRVSYNMISIGTLSLLAYFTYIFIDIIIYTLGNISWSSGIFYMVGRVVVDPSIDLPSLCEVVPRVLILITLSMIYIGHIHE